MATQFACIDEAHRDFIARQHIFFTASATGDSHINLSPRGADLFRTLHANGVAYLDRTGSGNETSAHLRADGRLTIMFCALEGPPKILRLYGKGRVLLRGSDDYQSLLQESFGGLEPLGARQIVVLDVEIVQTSCGYGVPLFSYEGERKSLDNWAESKGEEGLEAYRRDNNAVSIDGLPTFSHEAVA
jgi:Pyridoxamine 5'-phosphate oxidase